MSNDFRLQNMRNIKDALDAETAANRGTFINEGIAGLEEQKKYQKSNEKQRNAYDNVERDLLSSANIDTYNRPIRLTMTTKGGKRKTKRRNSNKKRQCFTYNGEIKNKTKKKKEKVGLQNYFTSRIDEALGSIQTSGFSLAHLIIDGGEFLFHFFQCGSGNVFRNILHERRMFPVQVPISPN